MSYKFAYSFDEEHYSGQEDSIESCLAEAIANAKYRGKPGDTIGIWIGQCVPVAAEALMPDADDIVEMMQERIYDHVGEIGETYLDDWTGAFKKANGPKITEELNKSIHEIFLKHGIDLTPTCYGITDVAEHKYEIPEAA